MNRFLAIAAAALLAAASTPAAAEELQADPTAPVDGEAAGKVIEFDPEGNEKSTPKEVEAPLKKGEISQAESCRLRLGAQCKTMQRCGISQEAFPCESVIAKCDELPGKAPYSRKVAEACAKAIGAMKCATQADFTNPASLDPSAKLPACKPVIAAEQKQAKQQGKKKKGDFAPSDFSPSEFKGSDFSPSDFSPSDFTGGF